MKRHLLLEEHPLKLHHRHPHRRSILHRFPARLQLFKPRSPVRTQLRLHLLLVPSHRILPLRALPLTIELTRFLLAEVLLEQRVQDLHRLVFPHIRRRIPGKHPLVFQLCVVVLHVLHNIRACHRLLPVRPFHDGRTVRVLPRMRVPLQLPQDMLPVVPHSHVVVVHIRHVELLARPRRHVREAVRRPHDQQLTRHSRRKPTPKLHHTSSHHTATAHTSSLASLLHSARSHQICITYRAERIDVLRSHGVPRHLPERTRKVREAHVLRLHEVRDPVQQLHHLQVLRVRE